jgi:hypothetical protein
MSESLDETGQLNKAICANDVARVQELLTSSATLRQVVRDDNGIMLLTERGADLTIRARVPGHYERPGELLDVSAAEYNAIFPLR